MKPETYWRGRSAARASGDLAGARSMLTSSRSFVMIAARNQVGRATPTWWKVQHLQAEAWLAHAEKRDADRRQADEISDYTRRIHPSNMDRSTLACWE